MKRSASLCLMVLLNVAVSAQEQPKLIVGIVVDQMRTDYIYRYWDKFEENGFKRLISEGYFCKNAHFNFTPTYTGPGHASIYSGTIPGNHGIIANNWYQASTGEMVNCVHDNEAKGIGTNTDAGNMGPRMMLAPTLGDAVRVSTLFKGKSIGISIKDRGAILPAGHSANAAYWMDYSTGNMVSSTYYMDDLPKWVKAFNNKSYPDLLSKEGWNTLLAIEYYVESTEDNSPYEKAYNPNGKPVFPYDLPALIKKDGYYPFALSPYGNTLLRLMADQAIIHEDLGQDAITDLLSISFSAPDFAGHEFGPQSIEIEDIYLRLDQEIAKLLQSLDERIGVGQYLLFLTADHAAAQVPAFMKDNKIPAGYLDEDQFENGLKTHLNATLGEGDWILNYSNQHIYLNHELLRQRNIELQGVFEEIEGFAMDFEGVSELLNMSQLRHVYTGEQFTRLAQNGWHPTRSGDIMVQYLPGWMSHGLQGTTHGSSYNYDTHVPLIFFGFGVAPGVSTEAIDITRIAPTVSVISSIAFPEMSEHRVVEGAIAR